MDLITHYLTWANYDSQSSTVAPSQKFWGSIIGGSGDIQDQLNGALTNSATTITVDSTADFDPAGFIKIDNEVIQYTGTTSTTFTGATRGSNSVAVAHLDNALVDAVFADGKPAYGIKN